MSPGYARKYTPSRVAPSRALQKQCIIEILRILKFVYTVKTAILDARPGSGYPWSQPRIFWKGLGRVGCCTPLNKLVDREFLILWRGWPINIVQYETVRIQIP